MKQITQKEALETIEEKRKSAENAYVRAHMEGRFDDAKKNKDYIDAYQDAYCYLASVEIVPEEHIMLTMPTATAREELKKIDLNKMPIIPYNEPKIEPLRNDRFREFSFKMKGKTTVDAKFVKSISDDSGIFIDNDGIYGEDYEELLEWWKYWKQM